MTPPVSAALIAAYRRTRYRCSLQDGPVEFVIDRPVPVLFAAMQAMGADRAAVITADNPRSVLQSDRDNQIARQLLSAGVSAAGWPHCDCVAIDPSGQWPVEHGLLIVSISREQALTLARVFAQHAIVFIGADATPVLLMCDESRASLRLR